MEGLEPGALVVLVESSAFADGSAGPGTVAGSAPEDKSHFARLDNAGPTIENLHLAMQFNEHYDITNWIGAGHLFTFSHEDETPDFDDAGVGRNRSHYEYHAGSSTSDVSAVSSPNDLAESANDRAYVLRATIRDLLGNETLRWWAGAEDTDGQSNGGSGRRAVDGTDDYKFGVDLTKPTQVLLDEEDGDYIGSLGVINNIALTDPRRVGIDYEDPGNGAGFDGSNGPVHTRIMRHAPEVTGEATCVVGQGYWYGRGRRCEILGQSGSHQSVRGGTAGDYGFDTDETGYYSIEYAVMDDAGNRADFITAGGVIDETPPVASALVPGTRDVGDRATLSAFAADDLDLNQIDYFLAFGDDAYQQGSASVGEPSLPFEQSATESISIESLPGGIATSTATPTALSSHMVSVTDQAGNAVADAATIPGVVAPTNILVAVTTDPLQMVNDAGEDIAGATQTRTTQYTGQAITDDLSTATTPEDLCWDTDDDGCDDDDSVARANIEFTIMGTDEVSAANALAVNALEVEGVANPFERVVFYVQLDDVADTTPWAILGEGRGRASAGTDAERTFTWRLSVRGSDLGAARGLEELLNDANLDVMIRAVGYTEDGLAVTVDADVTITLTVD